MAGKIFTGALLVVSMRWIDRLLGLVSTLILARLLMPADFGIVAMASVVVGLIDVLLDMGVIAMLVHKPDCDAEDYHNCWTVRVLESLGVAALIIAVAPLAADFYNDERVAPVLRLMAIGIMVSGFENIGVVSFQKELQFGKDFQVVFLRRISGFAATLGLALWLQNYWAMPLGALAGRLAGVAVTYAMHPFRPRPTLSRIGQIWSFSQWMLLRNSGDYFATKLDKMLVGQRFDAAAVGAYSLADEIAIMPTNQILPIGRVLFPAFVQVRDQPEQLRYAYLLAVAVQAVVTLPAAAGLTIIAHDAVALLLGERWLGAVPFVQVLALVYGCNFLSNAAAYLLLTLGRVRFLAFLAWGQIGVLLLGAVTFLADSQALALAQWRLVVMAGFTLGFVALVAREKPVLGFGPTWMVIWRPLVAAAVMAALLHLLPLHGWPLLATVLARCTAGAALYTATLLALWLLAGRPPGAEAYILGKCAALFRRAFLGVRLPD